MKALQRSMKARRNLIGLIVWELFFERQDLITRVLLANGLKSNKAGLLTLEQKLDNRLNLEHNFSNYERKNG